MYASAEVSLAHEYETKWQDGDLQYLCDGLSWRQRRSSRHSSNISARRRQHGRHAHGHEAHASTTPDTGSGRQHLAALLEGITACPLGDHGGMKHDRVQLLTGAGPARAANLELTLYSCSDPIGMPRSQLNKVCSADVARILHCNTADRQVISGLPYGERRCC